MSSGRTWEPRERLDSLPPLRNHAVSCERLFLGTGKPGRAIYFLRDGRTPSSLGRH
jgi:hypothetical protein